MNKEQLMQTALADPHCQEPAFLNALDNDPQLSLAHAQALENDKQLQQFFENSAPKMSSQALDSLYAISEQTSKKSNVLTPKFGYMAIAASLFITLFSLNIINYQDEYNNDLMAHALSHSAHGDETAIISAQAPLLTDLNAELKQYGVQLANAANVVWSKECDFEGIKSAHLIYQVAKTKYDVYLVPKTLEYSAIATSFDNEKYHGTIEEFANGYLVIVSPINKAIESFKRSVTEQVLWQI